MWRAGTQDGPDPVDRPGGVSDSRSRFDTSDSLAVLRTRLRGDTLRYAPAVLVPAATSVLSVALFTRLLGTADYGLYSVAAAVVSIATIVAGEWIGQSVLRYLPDAETPSHAKELVGDALGLAFAVALVLMVTAGFVRVAVDPAARGAMGSLLWPATALLVAEIAFTVLGAIMQAGLQSRSFAWFRVAGALCRLGMALGFVLLVARGVPSLLAGAASGRAIVVLAAVFFVARRDGAWVRPRFQRRSLGRFAGYGIPMVGWTLASQVLGLSDRFVIGAYHGTQPVGIYSANYNLVTMGFGLLGGPLLMAAHPLIVGAWRQRDTRAIGQVIAACSRPYLIAVTPVLVLLVLCSHDLVSLILAGDFREGSRIVPVIALGSFVWGFAMYGHKGLELGERTRMMLALVAVCAVLNVALNLIFVPRLGYIAAAWTTLASNSLYPVLVYLSARRGIPWRIPWPTLVAAGAAGGLAGLAGWITGRALAPHGFVLRLAAVTVTTLAVYGVFVAAWLRHRAKGGETVL